MQMIITFPNGVAFSVPLVKLAEFRQRKLQAQEPFGTRYQDRRALTIIRWVVANMSWADMKQFISEPDDAYAYRTMWSRGQYNYTYR